MLINTREKLHQQIGNLPDSTIKLIDEFIQTLIVKQKTSGSSNREKGQWLEFAIAQFFSEDDKIEYFLEDANEVYESRNRKILF